MGPATAFGDLSILPRELRDEVYAYLVPPKGYITTYSDYINLQPSFVKPQKFLWERCGGPQPTWSNLAILRSAKCIHEEAMVILYSAVRFSFLCSAESDPRPSINTNIINRIMTVEFQVYGSIYSNHKIPAAIAQQRSSLRSTLPGPLSLFQGPDVYRSSIQIYLSLGRTPGYESNGNCNCNVTDFMSSPFFNAIKALTGFGTVTLKFSFFLPPLEGQPWPPGELHKRFEPSLQEIGKELEPSLGVSTTAGRLEDGYDPGPEGVCHLEFHPRAQGNV